MSTAIYVLPAALFFLAASLLFTGAKKAPAERARLLTITASVFFIVGLILLGLGFYRLFTT